MAENITGELKVCNEFFVTYYWSLPAAGHHFYTNITLITISLISAVFGTIANFLVVLSYFKNSRLRTVSNVPLISLAFSDLMVTAVVLPLYIARLLKEIYGTHNCLLWTFYRLLSYFPAGVSLLTVTFISVERFITLAYPYRYQTILTRLRMKIIVGIIWCFAFFMVVANLLLIPNRVFLIVAAVLTGVCIITLLSIWVWVFKLLQNHKRRIATVNRPSHIAKKPQQRDCQQEMRQNTYTSGAIVVGLILCYLPLVFSFVYYCTEPTNFIFMYLVTPWSEMIILAHSFFDPLYVFWRKSEFRQTTRTLICRLIWVSRDADDTVGYDNSTTKYREKHLD